MLEVKAIVEGLENIPGSIGTRNQIKKRWVRGWEWIFEKEGSRAKGKKAEKPKLVLDRDDLLCLQSMLSSQPVNVNQTINVEGDF